MASRTVVRSDMMRANDYVDDVIKTWKLRDMTSTYELVTPLSEGNQGDIYKMIEKAKPYVLKIYKSGLNRQYAEFQADLLKHMHDPEVKAHPGYAALYFSAVPVGWATHMGKKGLVFRYVVQPREDRLPDAGDQAQAEAQMQLVHQLKYVHLDLTARNLLLGDEGKCFVMDFDCVCRIGEVPLGPLPNESSKPIMRRDPAQVRMMCTCGSCYRPRSSSICHRGSSDPWRRASSRSRL